MIPVEHQRDEVPARKTGAAWLNRRSVRVLVWLLWAGIVGAVIWVSYVAVSLGSLATYGPCGGASIQESYGSTLTAAAAGGSLCLAGIPVAWRIRARLRLLLVGFVVLYIASLVVRLASQSAEL